MGYGIVSSGTPLPAREGQGKGEKWQEVYLHPCPPSARGRGSSYKNRSLEGEK
jgi:hypothetical protein